MKVKELMTSQPEGCNPGTNLARAVQLMWDADCGVLPVVDSDMRVVGIITDRDICVALGTRNRRASDIRVAEVMRKPVETCAATDDVRVALEKMRDRRVRRLPVCDPNGRLVGVVSLNDAVLATAIAKDVEPARVLDALRAICAHSLPVPAEPETVAVG